MTGWRLRENLPNRANLDVDESGTGGSTAECGTQSRCERDSSAWPEVVGSAVLRPSPNASATSGASFPTSSSFLLRAHPPPSPFHRVVERVAEACAALVHVGYLGDPTAPPHT